MTRPDPTKIPAFRIDPYYWLRRHAGHRIEARVMDPATGKEYEPLRVEFYCERCRVVLMAIYPPGAPGSGKAPAKGTVEGDG